VFLSHSSDDDSLADLLAKALATRKIRVFIDHNKKTGIAPGDEWLSSLKQNINRCRAVIILVTNSWVQSQWCQAEHKTAALLDKKIIPIVVDGTNHQSIEPSRQKIALKSDQQTLADSDLDALLRALPANPAPLIVGASVTISACLLLLVGLEHSATGPWSPAPIRGGMFIDMATDPRHPRTVYAISRHRRGDGQPSPIWSTAGLYLTEDCGQSWRKIPIPDGMANPNRVLATREEIFIATESGYWINDRARNTWTHSNANGVTGNILAISPIPQQSLHLFVGTMIEPRGGAGGGTFSSGKDDPPTKARSSTDGFGGGMIVDRANQQRLSIPHQINDIAFRKSDPTHAVLAAGNDGVYYTFDQMRSVYRLANCPKRGPLRVSIMDDDRSVYVGTRERGVWRFDFPNGPGDQPECTQVIKDTLQSTEVLQLDGEKIISLTSRGLFVTSAKTYNFNKFAPHALVTLTLPHKAIRCEDRLLVATGNGGVLTTKTNSLEWQQSLTTENFLPAFNTVLLDEVRLASAGVYVFATFDKGASYEALDLRGEVTSWAAISTLTMSKREASDGDPNWKQYPTQGRARKVVGRHQFGSGLILAGTSDGRMLRRAPGEVDWIQSKTADKRYSIGSIQLSPDGRFGVFSYWPENSDAIPEFTTDRGVTWMPVPDFQRNWEYIVANLGGSKFLFASREGELRIFDATTKALETRTGLDTVLRRTHYLDGPMQRLLLVTEAGSIKSISLGRYNVEELGKVPGSGGNGVYSMSGGDGYYYLSRTANEANSAEPLARPKDGSWSILWVSRNLKDWREIRLPRGLKDAYLVGLYPGRVGLPVIASSHGLFSPDAEGVCWSEVHCFSWSWSKVRERIAPLVAVGARGS
jgi:hypothetical protein